MLHALAGGSASGERQNARGIYTCDAHLIIDLVQLDVTVHVRRLLLSSDAFHGGIQFDHKQIESF
jgi:hypothetical protein